MEAVSDPVRVVLEGGIRDAEITVRVSNARDELLDDLEAEELCASRVMEFSATSTLEVLSTSLATYAPIAGAVALGVRSVPRDAFGVRPCRRGSIAEATRASSSTSATAAALPSRTTRVPFAEPSTKWSCPRCGTNRSPATTSGSVWSVG